MSVLRTLKPDRLVDLYGVTAIVQRPPAMGDAHGRVTQEILIQHADGGLTVVRCTSPSLRDVAEQEASNGHT